MNERAFGRSWCYDDGEGSQVEDAVCIGAARTKDSRSKITVLIVQTRSIAAAVTMAPLLACKQCFMLDARFESNVTGVSSIFLIESKRSYSRRHRRRRHRCSPSSRRFPRVRWTAIIEVATSSSSRISRTSPRQDGMDGRDESWSSSCHVVVVLVLVLAVAVVVAVAAAARNRAPAVCVCWFVVDASNVCARARRWAKPSSDGQTWLMRHAFNCYLTSGNEPEKRVR